MTRSCFPPGTMRDLDTPERETLERLIDARGLSSVLMALSEICGEKSEHLLANWQDKKLAKDWATLEGAIGCVVPRATARGL
jgi:hypothetical protein